MTNSNFADQTIQKKVISKLLVMLSVTGNDNDNELILKAPKNMIKFKRIQNVQRQILGTEMRLGIG